MLPNRMPSPGSAVVILVCGWAYGEQELARWTRQGWASCSSLPPSLAMAPLVLWAQHHDSVLLTQAQWILPSSFLSIPISLPCSGAQGQAPPSLVLSSASSFSLIFCPLPLDNYASAILASNQSCSTSGPLY